MTPEKRLLVTSALPYANGDIHIGHLVEYIQTDIWVRLQKMRGNQCCYVCADDAHGTPIMLRARQEGIEPEALIQRISKEHQQDFADFNVGFDNYHSTHSEENRQLATLIYERLRDKGHIAGRTITQAFDPVENMFLPDRFIKGECPKCGGAWFQDDQLRKAKDTADPDLNWMDFEIWKHADRFKASGVTVACPTCSGSLVRIDYDNTGVEIDCCPQCKGIWLDKGEVKKITEDYRVAIRNYRRDAIDTFKKQKNDKEISEDELFRLQDDAQKETDKFIKTIDELMAAKEKEVMEV